MTAEPTPRPLSLVAQSPQPDWRAESLLRQWDPESQLVGTLMLARHAGRPDPGVGPRRCHLAARQLVGLRGHPPHRHRRRRPRPRGGATHRPPADAAHPGAPVSAARHHQLAIHLADLYTQAVTPMAARQYAREVLEDAYRRAVESHGIRMTELAQSGTSRSELTDYLTDTRAALAGLWRRAEAATR